MFSSCTPSCITVVGSRCSLLPSGSSSLVAWLASIPRESDRSTSYSGSSERDTRVSAEGSVLDYR